MMVTSRDWSCAWGTSERSNMIDWKFNRLGYKYEKYDISPFTRYQLWSNQVCC